MNLLILWGASFFCFSLSERREKQKGLQAVTTYGIWRLMAALKRMRHEMFAREYILNGENASAAYRLTAQHFPNKPLVHPKSAAVVGYTILQRPEVKRRIFELRDIMAKKSDITLDKLLTDIQEAMFMAKTQAKPNDVVNAALAQAKLVGLLRDRVEAGAVGDFDGIDNISEVLEKVAQDISPEVALALSKAFGYTKDEPETQSEPVEESPLAQAIPPSDAVN